MSRKSDEAKAESLKFLRSVLPPGSTIYSTLCHVSRSGMQREIKQYALTAGGPVWLSGYVANALGLRRGKRDGVIVNGCGMDMGFHVAYELSHVLYREGFDCIGDKCPSNDHSNGDRDYTPHRHKDGGYSLKHSWL